METVFDFSLARRATGMSSGQGVHGVVLNRYRPSMMRSLKTRRPATLASLAAELGVSRTTVSNAYNRPDQLSAELRRRVLDTARRLGYPGPDPVARSLRTRQAGAVGLLLTESLTFAFEDPAARGFLEGLAEACQEAGRGLLLVPGSVGEAAAVHRAAVDGFVVYSVPDDDPQLAAVLGRPVPTVLCDQPTVPGVDRVGIDDGAAMAAIAEHVLGLGHRRVGVLCLPLGREPAAGPASLGRQLQAHSHVQRARLAGLRQVFDNAGVDWSNVPVVECAENSVAAGQAGAAWLLDRHQRLTAVMCLSDLLALGLLAETERRPDLRVPDDLTVTGFDGIPEAGRAGLTTVRQPFVEKGRAAGRLLLQDGDSVGPRTVMLATELVPGRTSAAPHTADAEWFSGL
jgi:DNA-binding LacI/PurR family transcriptional regulator